MLDYALCVLEPDRVREGLGVVITETKGSSVGSSRAQQ